MKKIYIHHTDTSEGWKTDVIYNEAEHKERITWSDGHEIYVSLKDYEIMTMKFYNAQMLIQNLKERLDERDVEKKK